MLARRLTFTSEWKPGFVERGNYFRVRCCAHKSCGNAQSCCLLHWEEAVQFSFWALGLFKARQMKKDLCMQIHFHHFSNEIMACKEKRKEKKKKIHCSLICEPPLSFGHTRFICWWRSFNSFVLYGAIPWPCGWRLMKSFSGDEGYQAPCSPHLIEQEFYIANYVVCIPLVSGVLSGGAQSAVVYLR